jgi:hypothetical protein
MNQRDANKIMLGAWIDKQLHGAIQIIANAETDGNISVLITRWLDEKVQEYIKKHPAKRPR